MRTGVEWFLPVAALAFSVASAATCAAQDSEYEPLSATKRLFPGIGPGLRAVRHLPNGNYCVLAAPTPGLTVFNPQGKPLLQIGPPAGGTRAPATPVHTTRHRGRAAGRFLLPAHYAR